MKNILAATACFLLVAGVACGATLNIVQPNGGETLIIGTKFTIRWSAIGSSEKIKLLLFKGTTKLGAIAEDLAPSPSELIWTVGKHSGGWAPAGNDYRIRIRTMSNSIDDFSDTEFSLVSSGSDLADKTKLTKPVDKIDPFFFPIQITSPQANGQYAAGTPLHIAWDKDIGCFGYLHLYLVDDSGAVLDSYYPIVNTGEFDGWSPDVKYTWPGRSFRIRLTMKNPSNRSHASGQSGLFSIIPPPQQP